MARLSIFTLSFALSFVSLIDLSLAGVVPDIELLPIDKHGKRTSFHKRMENPNDDYSGLDLRDFGTFLWGAEATSSKMIANLTLDFADDYEAIVDMDDFAGLVKAIDCTAPDLSLEFKDEKSFSYAHEVWDWVNTDDNYTFVLVASAQACEPESRREPFLVSDLTFDEVNNKVLMKAVLKTWEDIAVTYSFKITTEPLAPGSSTLPKRDGKTMSLEHDFSRRLFDVKSGGLDIGVSCNPCGTEGSVNVDFDLETKFKIPKGASMTVTPQNIAAAVALSLELGGELTSAFNPADITVVSVPLTGIDVAGFFKLGIFLTVDVGFQIDAWRGSAKATMGARMAIPNTSNFKVNLLGGGDTAVNGWVPTFTPIPPSFSAKVEGSAEAYTQVGVEVTAKGLGKGFTVGLDMKMPYIQADFTAMADTAGVCGTKKTLGVDVQADVGAELYASAALNDNAPFWTHTLFDKTLGTIVDKCFAFGPENASGGNAGGGSTPPKKSKKPKSKTPKPTSKKPKPTSSAPAKSLKPITLSSKKPKPTKKLSSGTKTTRTTKAPSSSDKSSSSGSKSASKTSASDEGSSTQKSGGSESRSASATSKPTGSDTGSSSSTKFSSSLSSVSLSSSSVRFSNTSSTHRATSRPASASSEPSGTSKSSGSLTRSALNSTTSTNRLPTITTSFITSVTASDGGDACVLGRSSSGRNGKRADCGDATLHVTTIVKDKSTPVLKTFKSTCSAAVAGQACYHYYSAIVNYPEHSFNTFTCSDNNERNDGVWTSTWEKQHPKNKWRDYLPKTMTVKQGGKDIVQCEKDEWPPAFFMPADAKKKKTAQIVRWLPKKENGNAGQIWKGFCTDNDGGKDNGQHTRKKSDDVTVDAINTKLVDLSPDPDTTTNKGADGKVTTTYLYEAKFTRAVFVLDFDWAGKPKPDDGNDWYLSQNPCWPSAIAKGDPGYNLLTEDKWYSTAGSPDEQSSRKEQKSLYSKEPDAARIAAADLLHPDRNVPRRLNEREFEILDDGYSIRTANISRRLADGEIEVIQCSSYDCSKERRELSEDEIVAIIPPVKEKKASMPESNNDVLPTAVPEKRLAPEVDRRMDVRADVPVATAAGWNW
jgi:hypothetical protein